MENIQSLLQAELLAICFGLQLSRSYNFTSVLIESDSLLAVNEISNQSTMMSEWGSIIADILFLWSVIAALSNLFREVLTVL